MRAHSDSKPTPELAFIGRLEILARKKVALFCSVQCPGSLIIKAYDLAQVLRHSDLTVVSGFQAPVERECFTILLRGPAPVILCPARGIDRITIRPEWREAIESGRLKTAYSCFLGSYGISRVPSSLMIRTTLRVSSEVGAGSSGREMAATAAGAAAAAAAAVAAEPRNSLRL